MENQPGITNFTEQCPWEANILLVGQEIPHLLWKPKVHYCVHEIPSLICILNTPDVEDSCMFIEESRIADKGWSSSLALYLHFFSEFIYYFV
jgi:hypothetical protein